MDRGRDSDEQLSSSLPAIGDIGESIPYTLHTMLAASSLLPTHLTRIKCDCKAVAVADCNASDVSMAMDVCAFPYALISLPLPSLPVLDLTC